MKIYRQETGKSCGVACIRSAINYYGNDFSEKDVWDKNESFVMKNGSILNPMISLGVTTLKFGLGVEYIGYDVAIVNGNKYDDLLKSLKHKSRTYFDYGKFIVNKSIEFIELGGNLKIEILTIEKIKKLLDKNSFVIVEIKPAVINKKSLNRNMHHKIILNGYTKKGFGVLDPGGAKKYNLDFDKFLLAFYSAGQELLVVRKKK
jgi:hypothetical protein